MHSLSFSRIYKSITSLTKTDLPSFVVLTGRNGSGKTHLLEALDSGHVISSIAPNHSVDTLLYNWNTIVPKDTGRFDPNQDRMLRSQLFSSIKTEQDKYLPGIQQQLVSLGIPLQYCSTVRKISKLDIDVISGFTNDIATAKALLAQVTNTIKTHSQNIWATSSRTVGDQYYKKLGPKIVAQSPEQFWSPTESGFFDNDLFLWEEVDPFQQAFGRVFTNYRELIQLNDRLQKYPPPGEPEKRYLNDADFVLRFGSPPWEFVNSILDTCSLDFRVDYPPMHETSSYEPSLRKLGTEVEMQFQDLSSGEKVLMSFALCLYNAEETRQEKVFPKLLLLDEVDAPLHPSMAQSLIDTIRNVLVEEKGVSVILTTHSPSTVALAPADSVYEMNPMGPSIRKTDQSSAISILTSGVPTLSVSFDGRRQVFVESRVDARIYDKLYQRYKGEVHSERSLVFLEVGKTDASGGEQNSGCTQVVRLVKGLHQGGNSSVLGLVDWDGTRVPEARIQVLSHGVRDGLESLIFDPLLLSSLLLRENRQYAIQRGIFSDADTYTSIQSWRAEQWQNTVNVLQNIIEPSISDSSEKIRIEYLSGIEINVAKAYLHMDDHLLESRIVAEFGFLQPKNRSAGALMLHLIETVLQDYREFLPTDLLATFELLLSDFNVEA